MICTSSYKDWNSKLYKTYSISGDHGKDADYKGECYPVLAPKYQFWRTWKNNIGVVPEEENNRFYVREFWNQVLSKLDVEKVYNDLDYSTLLCYEPNDKFCHRHIVAAWFEILLDEKVSEAEANEFSVTPRKRPAYIKEYLEEAMRESLDMRGFNSLRAFYLFDKSEKLETKADELEARTGEDYSYLRQTACFMRCDADMVEEEYNKLHNNGESLRKK